MQLDNQRRPTQYVSFHDLKSLGFEIIVKEFDKEKPNGSIATAVKIISVKKDGVRFDKEDMKELLNALGIDTQSNGAKFWVTPKKLHKCLTEGKKPVYDYRYMGYERTDKTWVNSGRASIEAVMYSSNMKDMNEQFNTLSKGGERDE